MQFENVYNNSIRASAYSQLEFQGTYYLAYRDLPQILAREITGKRALDLGCGTGRSTRFLQRLGFDVAGVDIARDMVAQARASDPGGDYRVVTECDLSPFADNRFDLVLSMFTFDNIPTLEKKVALLKEMGRVLDPGGRIVSLVSSPEIYRHEWASFSTHSFAENTHAKSGDPVRIIITDIEDARPVEDIVCSDEDYRRIYSEAGFVIRACHRPLGMDSEPIHWVNETKIPPWVIYVLQKPGRRTARRPAVSRAR